MAYARHYPAINWTTSYSEYIDDLSEFYDREAGSDFLKLRQEISNILIEENQLMEIVKLIGADVLPDEQKLIIDLARVIRVGFLQQNAYHKDDTYVPLQKQKLMMEVILTLYNEAKKALSQGVSMEQITSTGLMEKIIKIKYDIPNDKLEMFDDYKKEIKSVFDKLESNEEERSAV